MIKGYRIDADLYGDPADEIAASSSYLKITFIFVSGYDRAALPDAFDPVALLAKPFDARDLLDMAERLAA
jgi:hypothetical protein